MGLEPHQLLCLSGRAAIKRAVRNGGCDTSLLHSAGSEQRKVPSPRSCVRFVVHADDSPCGRCSPPTTGVIHILLFF
jgi:hypothetical protein